MRTLAQSIAESQTAETELMTGMLGRAGRHTRSRRPEALRPSDRPGG